MTTSKKVKKHILSHEEGRPFSVRELFKLGSRRAVDCTVARLVAAGVIVRVSRGVYMRPKASKYVTAIAPSIEEVVSAIARGTGETTGVSGAEAAMQLKLSTQVPMGISYYTTGPTRALTINNQSVLLKHVADRKLALAGTPAGIALSALWYLGAEGVNESTIHAVVERLSPSVLDELEEANPPAWMADQIQSYRRIMSEESWGQRAA